MPSFLIQTLGCKLNQLESEAIIDAFSNAGFDMCSSKDITPSVIVINTCTVTSKADQKARRVIRKALRDYPDSVVIVTGCYAQLNKDDLQKLETDNKQRLFIVGKDEILEFITKRIKTTEDCNCSCLENWQLQLPGVNNTKNNHSSVKLRVLRGNNFNYNSSQRDKNTINQFEFNPSRFSEHTRSFLKIQDGCDNSCTYCRIRLARGQSISLDADEVLSRLRTLEQNYDEAVLTGVNICQYKGRILTTEEHGGRDFKNESKKRFFNLTELLNYLLYNTEKINIRLSSLEPEFIDEKFAKVITNKRIRPHFHLSVQSGCKKILEKMGRSYDSQTIEKAVSLLRGVKDEPHPSLTMSGEGSPRDPFIACDIITGFPSETDADFNETFNLCKKIDFAWIHVFPYSKRPGTPAFSFPQAVKESDITERVRQFTELAEQGRAAYVKRWIGKEVDVLIEKGGVHGITENYLKTLVRYDGEKLLPGTVLRCKLAQNDTDTDIDVLAISDNLHAT